MSYHFLLFQRAIIRFTEMELKANQKKTDPSDADSACGVAPAVPSMISANRKVRSTMTIRQRWWESRSTHDMCMWGKQYHVQEQLENNSHIVCNLNHQLFRIIWYYQYWIDACLKGKSYVYLSVERYLILCVNVWKYLRVILISKEQYACHTTMYVPKKQFQKYDFWILIAFSYETCFFFRSFWWH